MKYHLAEACQNTFVLLDCLEELWDDSIISKAHHFLKQEDRDDALILSHAWKNGDALFARMNVVGMDGALAEFCGNGSRACAAYLFQKYRHISHFYLKTPWGDHPLFHHSDDVYSIKLPRPSFTFNQKFVACANLVESYSGLHYVEMIEPHLIIQKEMSDEELLCFGREINQQTHLFPLGINVNAWYPQDESTLHVKTYERGVQRLTRSCGTGSISCAAFFRKEGQVFIKTPGGTLEINLFPDSIQLKGSASLVEK